MNKVVPVSIVLFLKNIDHEGFFLWMQKRADTGTLNGLWEFPGGKIHSEESALEAALREVWEEVGVKMPINPLNFKTYPYSYEGKNIVLHVFLCQFSTILEDKGVWEKIDFKGKSGYLRGKIPLINHLVIDEVADYLKTEYQNDTWKNLWRP